MPAPTNARLDALETLVASIAESVATLVARVDAPATSRPRKGKAKSTVRTYASKDEREAGGGFSCSCGRTGLRVAVHAGSSHNAPDGTVHKIA